MMGFLMKAIFFMLICSVLILAGFAFFISAVTGWIGGMCKPPDDDRID